MKKSNTPHKKLVKPGWCILLEGYLRGIAPAESYSEGVTLRTSADIVADLADMTDTLTESMVTDIMAQLGFRPHFEPFGGHGWMLRRDPLAAHDIFISPPEEDSEDSGR